MIDLRAKELTDAINRLCDILEGKQPAQEYCKPNNDVSICKGCGMLYSLKYGHRCIENTPPEER